MNKTLDEIKVSVIVAIYKVAPYLDQLIQSIIQQTHRNLEIILVDDGSPDECGAICDKYAKMDNRIIVIHQKNAGGCAARNAGLNIMTGKWFTFVDGDDWLEPIFIEYLLGLALSMGAELALSDCAFTSVIRSQNNEDVEKWSSEKAATEIISFGMPMGCWNKLYNTEMVRRNNLSFSIPWHGEGMYFATMAVQFANYVAKGHLCVYHYRTDNVGSSTHQYNVQNGINGVWNIKNLYKVSIVRTPKYLHTVKWHIWFNYNYLLRQIVGTNSYLQYWKEFLTCRFMLIWMYPSVIFHGEYNMRQKYSMLKRVLFPVHYAKQMVLQKRN